ncbi:hypothetical protein A2U01_0102737, partial [Trifolium medium]|nr:hypothetical protein [Trifolium medium]
GVSRSGVCFESVATLLIWVEVRSLQRSQELEVLIRSEGVEYEAKEVARILKGL